MMDLSRYRLEALRQDGKFILYRGLRRTFTEASPQSIRALPPLMEGPGPATVFVSLISINLLRTSGRKCFAIHMAKHNSAVYDVLAVPSVLSHVVESTCDPLALTKAV